MFEHLSQVPPDPLLGIIEKYRQDSNPKKIDLGVGVYKDDHNVTPVLNTVKLAEAHLLENQISKSYLGPFGDQAFTEAMLSLALGASLSEQHSTRIAALQTPGGCGALRVAAELIVRANSDAKIWVSDPTWANHVPLLGDAGVNIATYPYYDYEQKGVRFEAMLEALSGAKTGELVLLHGCCHNPCGADLSQEQWKRVVALISSRGLIPFVDMAYQGFGDSLEEDAFGLRLVIEQCPEAIFAISCSKNFGLYRDRVGVVGFQLETPAQAKATMSNLTQIVRGIYSMPPDHGAAVVAKILSDESLKHRWVDELTEMRGRIHAMRTGIADTMDELGFDGRFRFVENEQGMFSFLGISPQQVETMGQTYGIYMAGSSRINVAGLNQSNLAYFCHSLADVLKS